MKTMLLLVLCAGCALTYESDREDKLQLEKAQTPPTPIGFASQRIVAFDEPAPLPAYRDIPLDWTGVDTNGVTDYAVEMTTNFTDWVIVPSWRDGDYIVIQKPQQPFGCLRVTGIK